MRRLLSPAAARAWLVRARNCSALERSVAIGAGGVVAIGAGGVVAIGAGGVVAIGAGGVVSIGAGGVVVVTGGLTGGLTDA